jgi:hypothetical protein
VEPEILSEKSGTNNFPNLNYFIGCRNNNGGADEFSDAQIGSVAIGFGLGAEPEAAFTLSLKTLWEGCTNLILP